MEWYSILMLIGFPSIFSAFLIFIVKKLKAITCDIKLTMKSNQIMLRERLRDKGEYYIKKGYIDMIHKQDYDDCYTIYHALGKNGVVDDLHKKVMDLPTELPKKNK